MGIKLSNNRYEEIKRIVVDVFVKYQVNCVPINSIDIALKIGIKVIPYSSKNENTRKLLLKKSNDGFSVEETSNVWYIFYNDDMNCGRVNHTIMHEIGHIVLDHTAESELAEKEINFFAKYALAPPILIHKLKLDNSNDIAKIFNISLQAADYAYSYYLKRTKYGNKYCTDYEILQLELFKEVINYKKK